MNSLKIVSFNCGGFNPKKGIDYISNLKIKQTSKLADILLLQETWLTKQETKLLGGAIPGFVGIGQGSKDAGDGLIVGHPPGGVAIFYRNNLSRYVKHLDMELPDWVTGIRIEGNGEPIVILCVYLPCCNRKNENEYLLKMGELISIMNNLGTINILVAGDFNSDIAANTRFGKHLANICVENDLICSSLENLPQNSYTHVSYAWHTTSWLDHCITTSGCDNLVTNFQILYDISTRDHIPISFRLKLPEKTQTVTVSSANPGSYVNWSKLSDNELNSYSNDLDNSLHSLALQLLTFKCNDISCRNTEHVRSIEAFYLRFIKLILESSNRNLITKSVYRNRRTIPGWSDHVAKHHRNAVEAYRCWRELGSPTGGNVCDNMKQSHRVYKNAVKNVKRNEENIMKSKLANKLLSGKTKCFWADIKKNSDTHIRATSIEGKNNENEISELWREHYNETLNCVGKGKKVNLNLEVCDTVTVTPQEVQKSLNLLKNGKAPGPDRLSSEHLKFGGRTVVMVLTCLFNLFLQHSYIPKQMMNLHITPVVKDIKKDITKKNNYRPIAIATALSKLLEEVLKAQIEPYINISDNQLGFKKQSGTEMGIYLIKEVMNKLKSKYKCGYVCTLDASKAFDRINHEKLPKKF